MGPAYRIVTERLCLRCFEPADAPAVKAAIDASLDHLTPWLPWAREEPQPLDEKVELLRRFRGRFDLGKDFVYGLFARDGQGAPALLGAAGLHKKQASELRELGYWLAAGHLGRGLATEAVAALVRVAFEVDRVERVEIRCDAENAASAAVARRLAFVHEGTLRARAAPRYPRPRGTMVWSLHPEEHAAGPSARAACEAFDALDRPLLELPRAPTARRGSAFR